MSELAPCAQDIYRDGTCVAIATGEAHRIEAWVERLRMHTGQPVDWHYAGGRAMVLCLGDVAAVREAAHLLVARFTGEYLWEDKDA